MPSVQGFLGDDEEKAQPVQALWPEVSLGLCLFWGLQPVVLRDYLLLLTLHLRVISSSALGNMSRWEINMSFLDAKPVLSLLGSR